MTPLEPKSGETEMNALINLVNKLDDIAEATIYIGFGISVAIIAGLAVHSVISHVFF
nr:MAG TPA: hypothetical protein [Caudoviricetes sp.]